MYSLLLFPNLHPITMDVLICYLKLLLLIYN
nr:MAG TPA: hypothetical protein [Crassvirales sp.]